MKHFLFSVLVFSFSELALAGGGGLSGGATEFTQMANKAQLVATYNKQLEQYAMQGQQLQAQMQNLIANPDKIKLTDVMDAAKKVKQLYQGAKSLGKDLKNVEQHFKDSFKGTKAESFINLFAKWDDDNTDNFENAMKVLAVINEKLEEGIAANERLHSRSQSTQGNLDSLQVLSQINVRQIEETQKLQQITTAYNQAHLHYLATQTAKEQKALIDYEKATRLEKPVLSNEKKKPIDWSKK